MNIKVDNAQLSAFAAVLNEGTFELAARKLNLTPSAISQRIKLLEDRLGQILIQRTTPCQPTAAGRIFLRYAEQVALLESEMFSGLSVQTEDASVAVRIPIVLNADSLDSWFSSVFQAVALDGSMILDVRTEDQDYSMALLREGSVMAGVSTSTDAIQGCKVEPLGVMRYLAVATTEFKTRYFPKGVNAKALELAPMLKFNQKDALQDVFISRFTTNLIRPRIHMIPSTRSFFQAACAGLGWGMMPEHIVESALQRGELIHIAKKYPLDISLYWHRWRISSTYLDRISSMVHEAAQKTLR
ncbi:LysR family transcriptional regulator ArgP [Undibacterium sp. RTI2.1]|uniref:LysR family transcriptional regulator ArgP n=1 Tax=unclassified Undibacterium TaxID=2630295 RepID=UPI002AB3C6BB|nr:MULTISPECIES: LysR family transcriptional regulator ArgP [unclassified Undibacterium]MDY7538556.1 LysR family transcriptional regulator ArgP [Undibacterium sp. 5I1]MEB0031246.1 LysR family transcriptional regulator ArgP [Undibacterium sp. RTI2.1]MEB0116362.1 LysR family transcriptional regulator ArgP [Undibacterium sp. RTI2.2]MEB0233171.1 LysR family transcriptional regulator ArgP [Undibacterium sp. 10I3]MEB0258978.1 LysR family transcriptional regulator ArgP [Undibacterium sp. 5I1]